MVMAFTFATDLACRNAVVVAFTFSTDLARRNAVAMAFSVSTELARRTAVAMRWLWLSVRNAGAMALSLVGAEVSVSDFGDKLPGHGDLGIRPWG